MLAVANYEFANGHYPPAYLADASGRPMHSWRVLLLPYMEQKELYDQYNFSEPWNGPNNQKLAAKMPAVYAFHGDYRPGLAETNYLAVVGPQTAWPGREGLDPERLTDSASSTIVVVENQGEMVNWMEPRDLAFEAMSFRINSPKGVSSKYEDPAVAMLDGSVHRLRKDLPQAALKAMLTADGGETVREDEAWSGLRDGRDRSLAKPTAH